MQFYDFFKDLIDMIPSRFTGAIELATTVLPIVLLACALFTAFFGLKCAGLWCSLTFFFTGCAVSAHLLLDKVDVYDVWFAPVFAFCIAIGVICGALSKYLFRAQLVASEFALVYASLPGFMMFLDAIPAKMISLVAALAIAFLTVKYKYIIVIATTSFSGSFIFWDVIENNFSFRYKIPCAILMGLAALAFQVYMNWETLKKTYEDVRMKAEKTKHGGEKAVEHIKEHAHHSHHHESEEIKETEKETNEEKTEEEILTT